MQPFALPCRPKRMASRRGGAPSRKSATDVLARELTSMQERKNGARNAVALRWARVRTQQEVAQSCTSARAPRTSRGATRHPQRLGQRCCSQSGQKDLFQGRRNGTTASGTGPYAGFGRQCLRRWCAATRLRLRHGSGFMRCCQRHHNRSRVIRYCGCLGRVRRQRRIARPARFRWVGFEKNALIQKHARCAMQSRRQPVFMHAFPARR